MKGQIRIEFIFGVVIFIIVIFMVVTQTNTLYSSLLGDSRKDALKAKAINIIDILVEDTGYPPNWDMREVPIDVVFVDDISPSMDGKQAPGGGMCKYPCDILGYAPPPAPNGCTNFNATHSIYGETVWDEVWPNCSDCDNITHPGTFKPTVYGTIYDRADINEPCPLNYEKNSSKIFEEQLNETTDRAALVVFDDWARSRIGLTSSKSAVEDAIDNGIYSVDGCTAIGEGIKFATNLLNTSGDPNSKWFELLLTDGQDCGSSYPVDRAKEAAANGIVIYTIGYTETRYALNETQLKLIAGATGGEYFYAPNASTLTEKYLEIAQRIKTSITRIGLAVNKPYNPYNISSRKVSRLYENCNFLDNMNLGTYRLKIYNSTENQILFCGYDSLEPPLVMETRYVYIAGDFGKVTLEMW